MSIFVILGLLPFIKAPGSSAVTHMVVMKGDDVLLNVMKGDVAEKDNAVFWSFEKNVALVKYIAGGEPAVSVNYTGRVEFSVMNYSLKLKNLQATDGGVYTARVTGSQKVHTTEYSVTVKDPVSPVQLTVDSVSGSSDSCNVTVTCSTQDSHISSIFRCGNKTCSQDGGERSQVTTSGASLSVYLVNDSIICNHSNQVSWTKDTEVIEHFCPRHAGSEVVSAGFSLCLLKTVVVSVGLIIMVAAVVGVHIMERIKKQK